MCTSMEDTSEMEINPEILKNGEKNTFEPWIKK
jgi:hypothetical protein